MDERVIRVIMAAAPVPSVTAGRTRLLMRGMNPSPIPCEGSQPRVSANRMTISRPNQKFGMATPIRESSMAVLSIMEYCFLAEIIPVGIPIRMATRIPATASTAVLGNRSMTCDHTLRLFL